MYARSPDPNKQSIKVPENYGGHAFRGSGIYNDMPPPARIDLPQAERSPQERDRTFDYDTELYSNGPDIELELPIDQAPQNIDAYPPAPMHEQSSPPSNPSIFSSLMPPTPSASARFPFGHGLGSEELLIIAMMLMIYLADGECADNELLLLLGLLLFAG